MNTTIAVKISDIGDNVGTLGWLLNQKITVSIGKTKDGKVTGAWLLIGESQEPIAFYNFGLDSYAGFYPHDGIFENEIARMEQLFSPNETKTAFNIRFTEAAWQKVQEISELGREQFRLAIGALNDSERELASKVNLSISAN